MNVSSLHVSAVRASLEVLESDDLMFSPRPASRQLEVRVSSSDIDVSPSSKSSRASTLTTKAGDVGSES